MEKPTMTKPASMANEDWRDRVTMRVPEVARILDISRTTAYAAARAGDIPTIKLAGRLRVVVAGLRKKLGEGE
jgi:excisionase family DNA binding protein